MAHFFKKFTSASSWARDAADTADVEVLIIADCNILAGFCEQKVTQDVVIIRIKLGPVPISTGVLICSKSFIFIHTYLLLSVPTLVCVSKSVLFFRNAHFHVQQELHSSCSVDVPFSSDVCTSLNHEFLRWSVGFSLAVVARGDCANTANQNILLQLD